MFASHFLMPKKILRRIIATTSPSKMKIFRNNFCLPGEPAANLLPPGQGIHN